MACNIGYIQNSNFSDTEKENLEQLHLSALRELLAFDGVPLDSLSKRGLVGDKMITYLRYPVGDEEKKFKKYLGTTTYLQKYSFKRTLDNGDKIIIISVLPKLTRASKDADFINLFAQEYLLRHGQKDINKNNNLKAIIEDEESRKILGKILFDVKDRMIAMASNPSITDTLFKSEIKQFLDNLDNEDFVYSIEAANNFVRYALSYSENAVKEFRGKNNIMKKLEDIENLPTFEERNKARGKLNRKIDLIKDKFYVYDKLKDISEELAFGSKELDDVFEVFNRYKLQIALEEFTQDADKIEEIFKTISDSYKHELELVEQIEQIGLKLTRSEIKSILDKSVFVSMKNSDGTIKQTVLTKVKNSLDEMHIIRDGIVKYMKEAQVNLLYDGYKTYTPQNQTEYQKEYGITKEKIRNSIQQSNSSIRLLEYGFKHGDQLPDETLALFSKLLKHLMMEKDHQQFVEIQEFARKFSKYEGKTEEFSKDMQTYTFEISNSYKPQFYEHRISNGKAVLIYTKTYKDSLGNPISEELEFPLPDESTYGRYFKLSKTNDDNWVYLTNSGKYVRVKATRALKGRNKEHRVDIERAVLNSTLEEELTDILLNNKTFVLYPQSNGFSEVSFNKYVNGKDGDVFNIHQLRNYINDAFDRIHYNKVSNQDAALINQGLLNQIENIDDKEERLIFKKEHYFLRSFRKTSSKFFRTATNQRRIAESTLAATSFNIDPSKTTYLIELNNGETIEVFVKKITDEEYQMFDKNGKEIHEQDVAFYYEKGKHFFSIKDDPILKETELEAKLASNPLFAEFYTDILIEYDKVVDRDRTGYFQHGKVGQTTINNDKTALEHIREIKTAKDFKDKSFEALSEFIGEDKDEYINKINEKGEYVDNKGDVIPPGGTPIKIKKADLNSDRLDVGNFMPDYSRRKYNQNYVANDLVTNLMGVIGQAIHLEKLYDLEPQFRNALLLSQGSPELGVAQRGSSNIVKSKRGAVIQRSKESQSIKALDFIIKSSGYESPEIKDALGKGTFFERIINPIRKTVFFQTLALNIRSPFFSNLPIGQINNFLVAQSGKYGLNSKEVLKASGTVFQNIGEIVMGTVGHKKIEDSHYLVKLAYAFNAIAGFGVDAKEYRTNKSAVNFYGSYKSMFLLQSATEVLNQMPLMIGFMKAHEISPGFTMYDAIRIDGKTMDEKPPGNGYVTFTGEDGLPLSPRDISLFTSKLNVLSSEAQGDYGAYQKVMFKHALIPSLALTFAGWLFPNMRKRFGRGVKEDLETGKEDFGGYQRTFLANMLGTLDEYKEIFTFGPNDTLGDYLKSTEAFGEIKQAGKKLIIGTAKTVGALPLHIFNTLSGYKLQENDAIRKILQIKDKNSEEFANMFKIKQLPNETDEAYNKRLEEAYDFYINALQTTAKEYTYMVAIMIIGLMLHAMSADDEEEEDRTTLNKISQFLEIQSRQLVSDMALGAPLLNPLKPIEFANQRSKDPLVLLRAIKINSEVMYNLIGFQVNLSEMDINFKVDDRYEKSGPGYEKGDLKLGKKLERAFGPWHQVAKLFSSENQSQWIKMTNQSAIFTDNDISEEEDN